MFVSSPLRSFPRISKEPHSGSGLKETLTCKDLTLHLIQCGYRYCRPKCRTWKSAFVFKQEDTVLCILFRKNGIDLRYYVSYTNEISIDKYNNLSMVGGELFKNHFNESNNLITQKIKVIGSSFTKGRIMDEMRTEDGRSYLLNPNYKDIKETSKEEFTKLQTLLKDRKDSKDISDYVRDECGGYWGDGIWS